MTPALRDRLDFERRLQAIPVATGALEACLEAFASPAFIVAGSDRIEFANTLGRRLVAQDAPGVGERLQRATRGEANDVRVTPLRLAGAGAHFLAIVHQPRNGLRLLVTEATQRWSLTPRQAQILELVAQGLSNFAIASRLSCAERTVEIHVSRLLASSGSVSRAQLVARLWNGGRLERELQQSNVRS